MGCTSSGPSYKKDGIRLMSTKLTFTKIQLTNLNSYFRKLLEDTQRADDSTSVAAIEATVERLVQRLMLGASNLDRRFSSAFLVSLNEPRRIKQLRFEYLLRIDALSTPALNSETGRTLNIEEDAGMPGFIRLKVLATEADSWHEYVDSAGRLRRDLVKAKLANLLATTIKRETASDADDRIFTSPGQVVDAEVLEKILRQPDYCRIFYGPAASDGALPELKKHRVALIEDACGILLRIGLEGHKTRDVEVRLLIGIGVDSWSHLADYPRRVPLHHCDALLHYTVAQSGMYAIAVGPYTGARCEDRATLWRIRVPAAEKIMNQHYADDSVPALTESVLMEILYQLREGCPSGLPMRQKAGRKSPRSCCSRDSLRVVSRHILRTVHRWSLERAGPDPLTSWAPDTLSRHVLLALDELVACLKCQGLRCYFHPRCNVMLQCAKGGIVHHEDSYVSDARVVESYLAMLHHRSFATKPRVSRPMELMESELVARWRAVIASLPRGNASVDYGYNQRQLEYLSMILQEILRARDASLQGDIDNYSYLNYPELSFRTTEQVENLVYLLKLIVTQARDQIYAASSRRVRTGGHRRVGRKKRHYNTTSHFDYSVGLLVDVVRRDRETANMDLENQSIMARTLLRWLYFGMDNDRKILEPILRPYLSNLLNGLHEYGWCAELWKRRQETYTSEMRSLTTFCETVVTQKISPAEGLVDYLSNGWCWAESLTSMIERSGNSLRLIFVTPERVLRYNLTFAGNKGLSSFSTWSKARSVGNIVRGRRKIACTTGKIFDSWRILSGPPADVGGQGHVGLRDVSPLTYVVSISRFPAWHRGPGDLVSAMISIGKFRILQEVAAVLPREERVAMLDMIQRVARQASRRSKKPNCVDFSTHSTRETYTPRDLVEVYEAHSWNFRLETDLLDTPHDLSVGVHQRCIIAERERQLQREMLEMHDTLRRNACQRQRSSIWDSNSVSSWSSSVDSAAGTISIRRYRVPIWDTVKAGSKVRDNLSRDRNAARNKLGEMISREESPTWSTTDNRRKYDDFDAKDGDRLPTWDTLEKTLNKKLRNYDDASERSCEIDEPIEKDCPPTVDLTK